MAELHHVPVSALPLDLLARVTDPTRVETIQRPTPRWHRVVSLAGPASVAVLSIATFESSTTLDLPPFADGVRWVAWALGGALAGLALAWGRRRTLRPGNGQGLVVGHASLVVVDDATIAVLPAERLALEGADEAQRAIVYDGAVVHDSARERAWNEALEASITRAKGDASSHAQDRFRAYAEARSAVDPRGEARRGRWGLALAALVGLLVGGVVETGPLLASSRSTAEERARHWDAVAPHRVDLAGRLDRALDRAESLAREKASESAAARREAEEQKVEEDRAQRARLTARIEKAVAGKATLDELHGLASERLATDEQKRVTSALAARCAKEFGAPAEPPAGRPVTGSAAVRRQILVGLCRSDGTLAWTMAPGTETADAEAVVKQLTSTLWDRAAEAGAPMVIRPVRASERALVSIQVAPTGAPHPARSPADAGLAELRGTSARLAAPKAEQDVKVTVSVLDAAGRTTGTYDTFGTISVRRRRGAR